MFNRNKTMQKMHTTASIIY